MITTVISTLPILIIMLLGVALVNDTFEEIKEKERRQKKRAIHC